MNENVRQWQRALLDHGYDVGRAGADGDFGPATLRASCKLLNGEPGGNGGKATSERGKALIKSFEGLRLDAYPDPGTGGEPWTIGVGHTGGVKKGDRITEAQADAFLASDLARFEKAVARLAPKTTQAQFDALVSFAFNLGEGALERSTLLKKHNAGDYAGAKAEFGKWINAAGRPMKGLIRRRAAEADLYGSDNA